MTPIQLHPVDVQIAEPIQNNPETAVIYVLITAGVYGLFAGLINIVGYYNSVAKSAPNESVRWEFRRALPIFGLAFVGALADFLIAVSFDGANATPIILALVAAGDRVESLLRNINHDRDPRLPVQQQVAEALTAVVDERDGIEAAFKKVHDAYEREIGIPSPNENDGAFGSEETDADLAPRETTHEPEPASEPPQNPSETDPTSDSEYPTAVDYSEDDLRLLGGMDTLNDQRQN